MNAVSLPSQVTAHEDTGKEGFGVPQMRTLLLTDLCDSTELVERIGDAAAAKLFRDHDALVLDLQRRWRGRLIDRSDGLLLLFERAIDGLGFALDYARGLRELGKGHDTDLRARAGLHVGEVLTWRNSDAAVQVGAKPLEVEGLAKPMAGRLMALARPGQILLSSVAEPLAHRAARELGDRGQQLLWKSYGRWRFKGVPEAQEIYEVGEVGIAPLRAPKNGTKAWRDVPWWRRPAALAAEAAVLAAIGIGLWFATRPAPAIAFNERDWVVVGDLRNLTGQPVLDESLSQAFRISLEQSRYVNLISDLKVRDTLARMQRKPGTPIDRAIGSEIAQRDGARALLLPTVAEVGGRLRVSAEVVDPRTQSTVYVASADGKGVGSALASIDAVTDELRSQLGEAMQNVQKTSVPLPNVATPSLDALKAFAVARNVASTTTDRDQAIGLYQRALQLDPQFALAHADMGRLLASLGELALAQREWRAALALPQRLSPQEKQWIELMLVQNDVPAVYFRKTHEYLALYPDDYRIIGRMGTHEWHDLNDFKRAEATFRRVTKAPFEGSERSRYSLGMMLLGQDRVDEALQEFKRARAAGFTGAGELYARAYEVRNQPAEADKAYFSSTAGRKGWKGEAAVVTWIIRGQWRQAEDAARAWAAAADGANDVLESMRARAAIASVLVLSGRGGDASGALDDLRQALRAKGAEADAIYVPASTELGLYAGLLAAHAGDRAAVDEALRGVQGRSQLQDFPTLGQLHQVLLAEQERMAGRPQAAVARLRALSQQDTALIAVQWTLMRALQEAGDETGARARAGWIVSHRGRVYAESASIDVLRFFNAAIAAKADQVAKAGARG